MGFGTDWHRATTTNIKTIKTRKLKYFGHIVRKKGNSLEKEIMQGTTGGARTRGKPRTNWMEIIRSWTGLNMCQLMRTTEDGAAQLRSKDG